MVALVKLKSYGITEEHILHLKNFFERNKTNPGFLAADLEQYGNMKGR